MKDLVDYIKYHGYITSIRDNVDKDFIKDREELCAILAEENSLMEI